MIYITNLGNFAHAINFTLRVILLINIALIYNI